MQFHIPDNLKNLGIFNKVLNILSTYITIQENDGGGDWKKDSLTDYKENSSTDSVTKLLSLIVDKNKCLDNGEVSELLYNSLLVYYRNRLFNARGSMKVFDILEEMRPILNINIEKVEYSVDGLTIILSEVSLSNTPKEFTENLFLFMSSLLYYEEFSSIIKDLKISLELESSSTLGSGSVFYTINKITKTVEE